MTVLSRALAILAAVALPVSACAGGPPPRPSVDPAHPSVELKEWEVLVSPPALAAGTVSITIKNSGSSAHDLTVIKTDKAVDKLASDGSRVTEPSVGVTTAINPGQTGTLSVMLVPGAYVFICNQPGHYPLGMRTAVNVQ